MDKLKITKNNNKSTVVSIRVNTKIIDKLDKVAEKTDRTRNELIGIMLQYALDNMELEE
jgi:predicted transcriptional regulator